MAGKGARLHDAYIAPIVLQEIGRSQVEFQPEFGHAAKGDGARRWSRVRGAECVALKRSVRVTEPGAHWAAMEQRRKAEGPRRMRTRASAFPGRSQLSTVNGEL